MSCDHLNREQIIAGLRSGKRLVIDRRDSPALQICLQLEEEGLVTSKMREHDEQSSSFAFSWAGGSD